MHMPTKATGRLLIFSLLTALFAGLLFTPGLPGEFVFDDIPNIVNNEAIQITELDASALAKAAATPQLSARKSVVWGKRVSVRVDPGGRRYIKIKNTIIY